MKYTNNYNLKKPESNDKVKIKDINDNMDTVDSVVGDLKSDYVAHKKDNVRHRTIKIFEQFPSPEDLLEGEIGLVLEKTLLHYKFNEVVGDKIIDLSGNRNDATAFGTTIVNGFTNGKARQFNGIDDYASTEPLYLLSGLERFKIELSFRKDGNLNVGWETLVSNYRSFEELEPNGFYINYRSDTSKIALRFNDGEVDTNAFYIDYNIEVGIPYKLIIEYNGELIVSRLADLQGNLISDIHSVAFTGSFNDPSELYLGCTLGPSGTIQHSQFTFDELKITTW